MVSHLTTSSAKSLRFASFIVTVLVFGGIALSTVPARSVQDDMPVVVKRAYKMGDSDRYSLAFSAKIAVPMMAGESDFKITATMKETTKETKAEGPTLLQNTIEKASLRLGDQETDVTAFLTPFSQKYDKMGKMVEVKMDGGDNARENALGQGIGAIFQQIFQLQGAFYPPKAVKTGDTWKLDPTTTKTKRPDGTLETLETTGSATCVGKEKVKNVETVKIKLVRDTTFTGPMPSKTHFEGFGNIDPKDGKFIKITGTVEGASGPLKKGEFAIDRLFGDERDNEKKAGEKKDAADKKP